MQSPQYPTPPDPKETAAAQTQMNKDTAITQYGLAATNQKTPYGSLTYNQIGKWDDGTPRYESVTELSPQQQGLFNLGNQTQQNLGQIGVNQSAKIGGILDTPFNIEAGRAGKLTDMNKTFLDPQWNEQEERQRTRLLNSGVRPGTEAYDREMRNFSTNKQRAYDQMYLDSYDTANRAALTERTQPINEITALLSGSQVQQPNFRQTPTPGVAPTDYIGAVGQNYAGQVGAYNAQMQQNNAMMSGLFGLGKTALGGWMGGF